MCDVFFDKGAILSKLHNSCVFIEFQGDANQVE